MELDEQISIQFIMFCTRFLAIFIMLLICAIGLFLKDSENKDAIIGDHSLLINWRGFGVAFSTALFSQLFQHSVPGLLRPLPNENKPKIPFVFASSLFTTC